MHSTPTTRLLRWPCLLVLALAAAPPARACTIPVFRYALEHWELAPYELVVFHRGELAPGARTALERLAGHANLIVTPVAVDGRLSPALRKLWDSQAAAAKLPWAVLRRPGSGVKSRPAWTGGADAAALRRSLDSPARQQLVAALSRGDTGVFIVLLAGDRADDEAATALLRRELAKLERLVKLPEQSGAGPRIRLALPLKVAFTVLPLRRDDAAEADLVRLLLDSEADLDQVRGPIVFPVFGRGRVLGSLYGKDLDAGSVLDVVSFLCGECSCQVKELNPGSDLLLAADWPAIFARIGPAPESGPETPAAARPVARAKPRPKPRAGAAAVTKSDGGGMDALRAGDAGPEAEARPARVAEAVAFVTTPAPARPAAPYRRWLWIATAAAAVLVGVTGAWAVSHWWQRSAGPR